MFGLLKKSTPFEVISGVTRLANESHDAIVSRFDGNYYMMARGQIEISNIENRKKLRVSVVDLVNGRPKDQEQWTTYIHSLEQQFVSPDSGWTVFDTAAYMIFAAIHKINLCSKAALAYPKDEKLSTMVLTLIFESAQALDLLLEERALGQLDPTPSDELYSKFPHIHSLIKKKSGLDEWWLAKD